MMVITFEARIKEILEDIRTLLIRKRNDYGDSFEVIWGKVGMISVIVRLMDKIERLRNLNGKTTKNESIEDTFRDIIGYSVLSLRMLKPDTKSLIDYQRESKNPGQYDG